MNHSRLKEVKQRGNQMQLQSSTGSWLKKTVKARVRGGGCGNVDVGCTSDNISGSILNSSRGDYRAAAVWENGLRKYDGALSKVS